MFNKPLKKASLKSRKSGRRTRKVKNILKKLAAAVGAFTLLAGVFMPAAAVGAAAPDIIHSTTLSPKKTEAWEWAPVTTAAELEKYVGENERILLIYGIDPALYGGGSVKEQFNKLKNVSSDSLCYIKGLGGENCSRIADFTIGEKFVSFGPPNAPSLKKEKDKYFLTIPGSDQSSGKLIYNSRNMGGIDGFITSNSTMGSVLLNMINLYPGGESLGTVEFSFSSGGSGSLVGGATVKTYTVTGYYQGKDKSGKTIGDIYGTGSMFETESVFYTFPNRKFTQGAVVNYSGSYDYSETSRFLVYGGRRYKGNSDYGLITNDTVIPSGETVYLYNTAELYSEKNLIIEPGATFHINDTLYINGTLKNYGTVIVENAAILMIQGSGSFCNYGSLNYKCVSGKTLPSEGNLIVAGRGQLQLMPQGAFNSYGGNLSFGGTFTSNGFDPTSIYIPNTSLYFSYGSDFICTRYSWQYLIFSKGYIPKNTDEVRELISGTGARLKDGTVINNYDFNLLTENDDFSNFRVVSY